MKRSDIWRRSLLLGATLLAPGAHADEAPASPWSGSLALTSDYLFRGISQTDHRPALQAGLEFDTAGGWYLGGWGSNVSWLSDGSTAAQPVSNSLEVDAYAGKRGQLGSDWTWDAGLYAYAYPGHYPHGYTSPQTLEGYAALGWKTLTMKYSRSFGNLFGVAGSHGSDYLELAWQQPLGADWALAAHVGRQRVAGHSAADYTDWKLGLSRTFGAHWSLALEWHDTDARRDAYTNVQGDYLGRATAVISLAKTL
ncbi:MAG: TorF family putative porin [Xanthomonadaceae bacterium]|nr:TorF family putative porin [Xanthomonadaceae bacterium]MDE2278506.1 TorF family putative porin [Xanthomonadaceae bacterium]